MRGAMRSTAVTRTAASPALFQVVRSRKPVACVRAAASHPEIHLIASDVDGTLLNSQQQLAPEVKLAVSSAVDAGVPLIVATGKARGPWAKRILPELGPPMPGVFLQGLLVCDGQGAVMQKRSLHRDVVLQAAEFAEKHGLTLTAYCGDRILCAATDEHTDRLIWYGEPIPEAVGTLINIADKVQVQKLIFMASQERLDELRPEVEEKFAEVASLTVALSGMLEVLPKGASKGAGLLWLLGELGVEPENVLACGDGENDIEMLQMAGVGVAMGNASPKLKAVATTVVDSNDKHGVAQAIQQFVLEPRGVNVAA